MTDTHFTFPSLTVNNCDSHSNMNTFNTVLVFCAMLSACTSCSSSYQPSGNQGSQPAEVAGDFHGGMTGGGQPTPTYVNQQVVANSPSFGVSEQPKPVESFQSAAIEAEKARPVMAAAAAAAATATTTQYICSCITINPVATVSPHHQAPTGDSFAQAPAAQQQAFASQQNQQESVVSPASSSQSVPVQQQSAGDNIRGY